MLVTRLWMGSLLIVLAVLVLLEGNWFAPWFPFLFVVALLTTWLGSRELLSLLPRESRPDATLVYLGTGMLCMANWFATVRGAIAPQTSEKFDTWNAIGLCFVLLVIVAFLLEMRRFNEPNHITVRLALTLFTWVYLSILPSFLLQLRWLPRTPIECNVAMALVIFVPKCGDIGAYFTGKFLTGKILGRNLMTPRLSPKKTWQGFCGGMIACCLTAVLLNRIAPVIPGAMFGEILFGLSVGLAGVFGDLGESLIKRDCATKDASQSIPGFGGVLDVVDSILFAAPVAYLWLTI